jgi:hypothetical protein
MITRTLAVVFLALLMGGCAAPMRYEWNQYDQRLYDVYKSPEAADQFVITMETHVRSLEAADKKPAPGLYAELGTFYLKRGDSLNAAQYYNKEMTAWPESKGFMTALIANLAKPKAEEKK